VTKICKLNATCVNTYTQAQASTHKRIKTHLPPLISPKPVTFRTKPEASYPNCCIYLYVHYVEAANEQATNCGIVVDKQRRHAWDDSSHLCSTNIQSRYLSVRLCLKSQKVFLNTFNQQKRWTAGSFL
jgi:hypothetical protein